MAKYKISGVWKDEKGTLAYYAFHKVTPNGVNRGVKYSKAQAVELLEDEANEAVTWIWDYRNSCWKDGQKVEAIAGGYLRSDPDKTVLDNLAHLINYHLL